VLSVVLQRAPAVPDRSSATVRYRAISLVEAKALSESAAAVNGVARTLEEQSSLRLARTAEAARWGDWCFNLAGAGRTT
jgi:hypothetical protein